eukprot:Gb_31010 [translate_table: standard]
MQRQCCCGCSTFVAQQTVSQVATGAVQTSAIVGTTQQSLEAQWAAYYASQAAYQQQAVNARLMCLLWARSYVLLVATRILSSISGGSKDSDNSVHMDAFHVMTCPVGHALCLVSDNKNIEWSAMASTAEGSMWRVSMYADINLCLAMRSSIVSYCLMGALLLVILMQ